MHAHITHVETQPLYKCTRTASVEACDELIDLVVFVFAFEMVAIASVRSNSRTWPEEQPAAIKFGCHGFHLKQNTSSGASSTI